MGSKLIDTILTYMKGNYSNLAYFHRNKESFSIPRKWHQKNEGVLGSIQANSIPFSDRHLLASVIAAKISEFKWKADWRNEIIINRDEHEFTDAFAPRANQARRWYHIDVKNLHHKKIAFDSMTYLESSRNILTGDKKTFPPVEF